MERDDFFIYASTATPVLHTPEHLSTRRQNSQLDLDLRILGSSNQKESYVVAFDLT